jgi:hypothetical protein
VPFCAHSLSACSVYPVWQGQGMGWIGGGNIAKI